MLPDLIYRSGVFELVVITFLVAWLTGGACFALWVWAVMRPKRDTLAAALADALTEKREVQRMNEQLADAVRRVHERGAA